MKILVLNGGSSTVKYKVFKKDDLSLLVEGSISEIGLRKSRIKQTYFVENKQQEHEEECVVFDYHQAVEKIFQLLQEKHPVINTPEELFAIGHRVVHGGDITEPLVIDDAALVQLKKVSEFAPLHNTVNVMGIIACGKVFGKNVKQIAVFDTSFHRHLAPKAYLYPLPYDMYQKHQIRKYGFHGVSYSFILNTVAKKYSKRIEDVNMIVLHLGSGCSACVIKGGQSIDTSMGFTPLEGLMMGTRSGDIDPGAMSYMSRVTKLSLDKIEEMLNKDSGLKGICDTSDLREVMKMIQGDDKEKKERAQLALDMFCYRIKKYIGAYYVAMDGALDYLVFTAGIGENSAVVREMVCDGLKCIGVRVDKSKNECVNSGDEVTEIQSTDSSCRVLVVPTNEELEIARNICAVLQPEHA